MDSRAKEAAVVIEEAAPPSQNHGSEKEKWMRQHK
jgi:hypothetical protein